MAFSTQIRNDALVAAARHCCVCHRYKGVKVEVHHIVPTSKGGTDTAENAIALCFDCHADAGHYNPDHPRGTKVSVEELRLARAVWHTAVATNRIEPPPDEDRLYCRYLVCKSFSALREIMQGNVSEVPATSPHLAMTPIGEVLSQIVLRQPESYRHSQISGDAYPQRDAYLLAHPDTRIFDRSSRNLFPYFEASRVPSREELLARVAPRDPLTSMLLAEGVAAVQVSEAFAYDEVCGDNCFQEIYRIRPLWGVFLAATNITNRLLRVDSLTCEAEHPIGLGYRAITSRDSPRVEHFGLPRMPLAPGATIVIPVVVILGPLRERSMETMRSESRHVTSGEVQSMSHCNAGELVDQLALIGPSFWPGGFNFNEAGSPAYQEVHELDLSNLYVIDRYWEAGCCPHLFFERSTDSSLIYWGELWTHAPDVLQSVRLVIPEGVHALILAELESEVAHVKEVRVGGRAVVSGCVLHSGQRLRIAVKPGESIQIVGHYVPSDSARGRRPDPWWKNAAIIQFINRNEGYGSRSAS